MSEYNDSKINVQDRPTDSISIVATIDFGTSYSGWAFSFPEEFEKDPTKAYTKHWRGGPQITEKTPTCILVHPDGKSVVAFGYEAEDKYAQLVKGKEHTEYYFFRQFKMILNKKLSETLDRNLTVEDVLKKTLLALDVFSMAIKFLLDDLLKVVNHSRDTNPTTLDDILLVLTVPALWTDKANHFMREAATKAGVEPNRTILALEPEVASIYCQVMPEDNDGKFVQFPIGARYLVVDAGGGTVDVTVHEGDDGFNSFNVKEVAIATGGEWGSSEVEKAFENFVQEVIGEEIFNKFTTENVDEWLELLREFERHRKYIDPANDTKIVLRIPSSLLKYTHEKYGSFAEYVKLSKFGSGLTVDVSKMIFSSGLCKSFYTKPVQKIVSLIDSQLTAERRGRVRSILMVGGFSESKILQHAVKQAFPKLPVYVPKDASSVVMRGAILYGHHPMSITERVLKYTYGVEVMKKFKEGVHPESKCVITPNGKFCGRIFSKHIEKQQVVKVGEPQIEQRYTPTDDQKTTACLRIFASKNRNPQYTDENCTCIGEVTFDLDYPDGDLNRGLWVSFTFSGTDVKVDIYDEKTGKTREAKSNFLGPSMI